MAGRMAITILQFLVISRWIHFASVFVLFGSSLFWFYMGRKVGSGASPRAWRATFVLLGTAAPLAALSGIAWSAGILANMTGGFGALLDLENLRLFLFETAFGPVSVLRIAFLVAAVVTIILPWSQRARLLTFFLLGGALLVSQAWLGHAAEGGAGLYGAVMIIIYGVHLLATGAWVGGLPPLLFTLIEQHRSNTVEARENILEILSRFSLMATGAVVLIIASGIVNAGFRVANSYDRLFDSAYGDVLCAKIAMVAAMLLLAGFNRFIIMPRLRAACMTQVGKLRMSVGIELALGVLVLGVAALLGITPPPQ
jgi:copper resistance protein D